MHKPSVKKSLQELERRGIELKVMLRLAQEAVQEANRNLESVQGQINRFRDECHHPKGRVVDEAFTDGPGLRHVPICQICGSEVRSRPTLA